MTSLFGPRAQLLLAALLFSTGGAAIKSCAMTSWQEASFRSGIAALALLLIVPSARRGLTAMSWLVGVPYAGAVILFVMANNLTTSANAIFLQSSSPLYLLLIGPLLLRERLRGLDVVFLLVIAGGMVICLLGEEGKFASAPDPRTGNLLALASGLCWALTITGLRFCARAPRMRATVAPGAPAETRPPAEGSRAEAADPAVAAVVAGNIIAFVVGLGFALPVASWTAKDLALIGYLGVFQIGLAYLFVVRGLARVTALECSLLLLLEPALNPLWAWWAHDERPSHLALVGGSVIIGSATLRAVLGARLRARA